MSSSQNNTSSAGTLIALDQSATAAGALGLAPGTTTYAIQMSECQTCARHSATINTMLTVMQQQAATLKEQQATIANLISMHGSSGAQKTSILNSVLKAPGTRMAVAASIVKAAGSRSPVKTPQPPPKRKRIRKSASTAAASTSKETENVPTENEGVGQLHSEDNGGEGGSALPVTSPVAEHLEDEDITATKIWLRGTLQASEKCPCPLPECAGRKFAASDMYYLRRHFQQVHRLTHPNPLFVVQCPISECEGEFPSVRDMRKHIQKDHKEIFEALAMTPVKPTPVRNKKRKASELTNPGEGQEAPAENGLSDQEAVNELLQAAEEEDEEEEEEDTAVEE